MKLAALVAASATLVVTPTAGAANPRHVMEKAVAGDVEATFSYDYSPSSSRFTSPHLTISRAGSDLYDAGLRPISPGVDVDPAGYFSHRKSVTARDLDGDGEPEVLLDLYSGGAHCCWYTEAYRYASSTGSYVRATRVWGNTDYRLADLDGDGLPEFASSDDRFAYIFTDFADSAFPVQIWRFRNGAFRDVTRRFPALIRHDARRDWRSAFTKQRRAENRGLLAAWAADQCLLRHCKPAFRQLETLRRHRRIGGGWDRTARRYLLHLRRFLVRTGYMR
jgi:hypothetical protein